MNQAIAVEREHVGLDAPTSVVTARTVQKMFEHIRNSDADPVVLDLAARLAHGNMDPLASDWFWVKHNIRFAQDDSLIRELFNERDHFELLISPSVMLRMRSRRGDCDDFTMLVLALARAQGFPIRIVTLACDRARPGEYSHVYGAAYSESAAAWIPLDASHGARPGWEVPAVDVQRRTEWDESGRIVFDQAYDIPAVSPASGGLGSYNTGLPVIGTIDPANPFDWLTLGGAAASLLFVNGPGKLVSAGVFLALRWFVSADQSALASERMGDI